MLVPPRPPPTGIFGRILRRWGKGHLIESAGRFDSPIGEGESTIARRRAPFARFTENGAIASARRAKGGDHGTGDFLQNRGGRLRKKPACNFELHLEGRHRSSAHRRLERPGGRTAGGRVRPSAAFRCGLGAVSRFRVVSQKRTGPRAMRRLATISPSPAGRISAARQRGTKSGYEATSATIANIVSRLHGTTAERSIRSIDGSIPGPCGRVAVNRRWPVHRGSPGTTGDSRQHGRQEPEEGRRGRRDRSESPRPLRLPPRGPSGSRSGSRGLGSQEPAERPGPNQRGGTSRFARERRFSKERTFHPSPPRRATWKPIPCVLAGLLLHRRKSIGSRARSSATATPWSLWISIGAADGRSSASRPRRASAAPTSAPRIGIGTGGVNASG